MTAASFHADGTIPSLKLLLNKSHMLTEIPLAHNVSSFGGRPYRPGALPGFSLTVCQRLRSTLWKSTLETAGKELEGLEGIVDSFPGVFAVQNTD